MVADAHVGFSVTDGVAHLELLRPEKRNAVTAAMWRAIINFADDGAARDDVRVLLLRGSGGVFCAGADLAEVKDPDGAPSAEFHALAVTALQSLARFPKPTAAVIEGACIGGGVSLAVACDIRFADPGATFAVPAVRHGLVYDQPSIKRLVDLMGPGGAAQFLYTAHRIDGRRAAALGLVDECSDRLDATVTEFAQAVKLGDLRTVSATKALLRPLQSVTTSTARQSTSD